MGAYARAGRQGRLGADLDRVFELFPRLAERRGQAGGTLSGGEQQMLAIGRALMARPKAAAARRAVDGPGPAARHPDLRDRHRDQRSRARPILLVEQNAQARPCSGPTGPTCSRPAGWSSRARPPSCGRRVGAQGVPGRGMKPRRTRWRLTWRHRLPGRCRTAGGGGQEPEPQGHDPGAVPVRHHGRAVGGGALSSSPGATTRRPSTAGPSARRSWPAARSCGPTWAASRPGWPPPIGPRPRTGPWSSSSAERAGPRARRPGRRHAGRAVARRLGTDRGRPASGRPGGEALHPPICRQRPGQRPDVRPHPVGPHEVRRPRGAAGPGAGAGLTP